MFNNLKINDKIYILKNNEGLKFYECDVTSVKPETPIATELVKGIYTLTTITAKCDEEEFKLDRLNAMQSYVELPQSNGSIIISTSREKINDYVKKTYDESKMRLSKMGEYKKKVEDGEEILKNLSLNPNDVNEIRFNKIEESVSKMSDSFGEMLNMLKKISPTDDKKEEQKL